MSTFFWPLSSTYSITDTAHATCMYGLARLLDKIVASLLLELSWLCKYYIHLNYVRCIVDEAQLDPNDPRNAELLELAKVHVVRCIWYMYM